MRARILVSAGHDLFVSFFPKRYQARLSRTFSWELMESEEIDQKFRRRLSEADGLITTWDSPSLGVDLLQFAPRLRIIAHCGGEVKRKFAAELFMLQNPDPKIVNA